MRHLILLFCCLAVGCGDDESLSMTTPDPGPRTEIESCDGTDNDNDGRIDEGVLNACNECGVEPSETCNGEDDDCDGRTDEGALNACGACGDVPQETCDGQDNDCDGQTDEHFPESPHPCASGICETMGINVCVSGPNGPEILDTCTQSAVGALELCGTGVDEDCDRSIDEGFGDLGNVCEVGLGIC